jgi:hypothetical protein
MPDRLKAGIESLSGIDMSDVRVHANSPKPARLGALAFTQGNQIYMGPGQQRHLPHEAWHVVQQAQGRVQAIRQIEGVWANDDARLEKEADEIGDSVTAENMQESLISLQNTNNANRCSGMISHLSVAQFNRGKDEIKCTATVTLKDDTILASREGGNGNTKSTRENLMKLPQTRDLFLVMRQAQNGMPMYACAEPNALAKVICYMTRQQINTGLRHVDITRARYVEVVNEHQLQEEKPACDTCLQWLLPNGNNYQRDFQDV